MQPRLREMGRCVRKHGDKNPGECRMKEQAKLSGQIRYYGQNACCDVQ